MRCRDQAFTLVEVLVALALFGIIVAFVLPTLTASISSNARARVGTSISSVAESWLDRFRSGQEPIQAGGACTGSATLLTCSYPVNYNYSADGISSHSTDAANMTTTFGPYNTTIQVTQLNAGSNTGILLYEVKATVSPKTGTIGGGKSVTLATRITKN